MDAQDGTQSALRGTIRKKNAAETAALRETHRGSFGHGEIGHTCTDTTRELYNQDAAETAALRIQRCKSLGCGEIADHAVEKLNPLAK